MLGVGLREDALEVGFSELVRCLSRMFEVGLTKCDFAYVHCSSACVCEELVASSFVEEVHMCRWR
jgi:hypothetical protein